MHRASLILLALAACNSGGGGGDDDDPPPIDAAPTGNGSVFDRAITKVSIEIDFESGQQPYTGPIIGFGDTFDLSAANLDRIFAGTKELVLPRVVAEMENVGGIPDEQLTSADLLALAGMHRDQMDTATTKTYYILFVSGNFADASGPRPGVLGVSIGDTGVIAMFKDVIRSTNVPGFPNVVRHVEQTTLIHEVGHAIGLVDNGVPLTSAHKDEEHGAHCNNDRCVMYYLNEGASDAAMFVQMAVLGNDTILWDAGCLADADALTGGPR